MLLPISWLKKFINISATAEQIAEKLTLSGSEVEKIVTHEDGLSKVYVGLIKEIKPHPNADKLRLAYVDIGQNKPLEIVCGASNIAIGQKVPCVLVGGSVPGLKIEAREVRGVKSHGMLCSQRELGIGDDHGGIFVLPDEVQVGADVVKLLELYEPVLELAITPNRADCFSVRGLAREVAALFGQKFRVTSYKLQEGKKKAADVIKVEIKDKDLCSKYMARVVEDITVAPSPLWLANKLRQVGIRPVNNIVDVTNYVMMELGQPLHAFDFDLLTGSSGQHNTTPNPSSGRRGQSTLVVRRAKSGEKLLALDGNTYSLKDSMLVIADEKRPLAIAGVMGGVESSVTGETKTVVLEAAVFAAVSVRKTSRALGLRSESSMRFEKGVDPAAGAEAINRAASMIAELAGGAILKGIVSGGSPSSGARSVKIATAEITGLLGVAVSDAKIKSILESLGFGITTPTPPWKGGDKEKIPSSLRRGKGVVTVFTISIPSWRADVTASADIAEEIGRLLDYNTLPKTLPTVVLQAKPTEPAPALRRMWRTFLTAGGYSEILTYSFYDEKLLALSGVPESEHIKITNPVNAENKYLRASLLPGLLAVLSQNSALLPRDQFCLFAVGKIFVSPQTEKWQLAVGLIDVAASDEVLFRRLRGLSAAGQIIIYPKGSVPGLRFRSRVGVLVIDLDESVKKSPVARPVFTPLPFYPQVERDLAITAPSKVKYKEIEEVIKKHDPLLKQVALFDVYHGLGEGTGLAFRLTFGSTDRTLEAGEVENIITKLKSTLEKKFAVSFR